MTERYRDPRKVGIAAIAVGAVVAGLVVIASTVSFGSENYTAHLAQTAGLRVGEDVQVSGVRVGEITALRLDGHHVAATLRIKKGLRLGAATTAEVRVATLLGTHYLSVIPRGSGQIDGNVIPLSQTSVPYNLQDVIDRATGAVDTLDPALLAQALEAMTTTLEAGQENFGPALRGIARFGELVATRSNQAGDLLEAARGLSDQLSTNSGDVLELMRQTSLVLNEVNNRREAVHLLLVKTRALATDLTSIVRSAGGDVTAALRDVRVVLAMLKEEDHTLKRGLELMAPSVRYLANATGQGPWIDASTGGVQGGLLVDGLTCSVKGTC